MDVTLASLVAFLLISTVNSAVPPKGLRSTREVLSDTANSNVKRSLNKEQGLELDKSKFLQVLESSTRQQIPNTDISKSKRSLGFNYYNRWNSPISRVAQPYQDFPNWQPQFYPIERPYYIPVWGSPGRQPLYFPPQPLFVNSFPIDNPPKGYLPPNGYLPPDNRRPCNNDTTSDRYGENNPVWDISENAPSTRSPIVPTRQPSSGPVTHPPLVHNYDDVSNSQSNQPSLEVNNQISGGSGSNRVTTTARPSAQGPDRCIWATISCCSANSIDISYNCFEQLGCMGAFWDTNPCDAEFARAAIETAMKHFNAK